MTEKFEWQQETVERRSLGVMPYRPETVQAFSLDNFIKNNYDMQKFHRMELKWKQIYIYIQKFSTHVNILHDALA